jgi:3-oxoacyl-[acyl-carrier protein] reductase
LSDWYQRFTTTAPGRITARRLGLPRPAILRRYRPGQPLLEGPALVGGASGGRLVARIGSLLEGAGVDVRTESREGDRWGAIVFDATGIADVGQLAQLRAFCAPAFRNLAPCGRLLLLGRPPESCPEPAQAAAQRAIDGFVRSAAKEARAGATANLLYVLEDADDGIESTVRFFLSARSAYVSGQVLRVGAGQPAATADWERPLAGRVAVVTGAARGIGAAIAETLARDGAQVVCVDLPAQGAPLAEVANQLHGTAFQIDITHADAPARLAAYLLERHAGADVLVHNAGITRDKLLVNMRDEQWDSVLAVNLESQLRINAALLKGNVLRKSGRVVCISSTSGIAGNRGQTNYAASKAGIIGMVQALAPTMAERDTTINAVAPGFIETAMTKAMPLATREVGRRVNSLSQGGLPVDVAEAVAWLGQPGTAGVNGQVVRVCGQSIVGA